ncbi:MAG: FemAB family PEP-CTERM system-associated protein [Rhodospirillales bacterium]|nr:MAG: FemAB family PEP-CTERM system-associated protein [Rhodospirillales bacterium]
MNVIYCAETPSPNLRVVPLDGLSCARWDLFVETCPDATFFHRSGWKTVIEETLGQRCYFLMAECDGVIRGVLPLTHVRSRLFGDTLISNAFCVYGGPAALDDAARDALDAAARCLARSLGVAFLEYRLRRPWHADRPCNASLYATFRKALDPDPEKNMLAIPRKQRAMIRKGIKLGLRSEQDDSIDRFFPVYSESVRNLGTPIKPRKYYESLLHVFGDDCQVLTIMQENQTVGSVMSFLFRDEVHLYHGGGYPIARQVAGYDFMYWEVMRRACERGFRLFDFSRSKQGTGAFAFKQHWGFVPEPLYHEFDLYERDTMPDTNPLNPKYQRLIALWRRLPVRVANVVGPHLARQLG